MVFSYLLHVNGIVVNPLGVYNIAHVRSECTMDDMRNRDAIWRDQMDEADAREVARVERIYDMAAEQRRIVITRMKQKYIKRMKRAEDRPE